MRTRVVSTSAALAALVAGSAIADDVRVQDLPEPVRATVEKEAKRAVIEDVERERRADGTRYYEVELERDDLEWKVRIDENGRVIERRRDP